MAVNFRTEQAAVRAGMFVKAIVGQVGAREWCRDNGVPLVRASGESINSAGGFLVPTEIASAIISNREIGGLFRRYAQVVPMGSGTISVPLRASGVSGTWMSEGAAIPDSQATLGSVTLVARKLGALVDASIDLLEDSPADLAAWITEEVAAAFYSAEDAAGLAGDGTSTYGGHVGICNLLTDGSHNAGKVAAASGHNTLLTVDATDLGNLVAAAPNYALENAAWYCSPRALATTFIRLSGAGGGIVVLNGELHWGGFPIRTTPALLNSTATATGSVMLLFGDLNRAVALGTRSETKLAVAERADVDDVLTFRGTERVAIVSHSLGDNDNAGPIVGLVGTA